MVTRKDRQVDKRCWEKNLYSKLSSVNYMLKFEMNDEAL